MKHKSVSNNRFALAPQANIPRSSFDRSFGHKTTFDAGHIIPIFTDEVLPGDTFVLSASLFARLATPIVPTMDNAYLETQWFFVPLRLLWDHWQQFCGEQINPGDTTDYLVPQRTADPVGGFFGNLDDYFGLPKDVPGLSYSAFYARAYYRIYNEWYRPQDIIDSDPRGLRTDDGPDTGTMDVKLHTKRHDYFTGALPWPQKGPGVELPIGSSAPLKISDYSLRTLVRSTDGSTMIGTPSTLQTSGSTNSSAQPTRLLHQDSTAHNVLVDITGHTVADLSQAAQVSINSMRQAFQIQRFLERDARGGTRYTELLRSHFGVISPDSRLQRPEYLGGSSTPLNIHQVPQTSSTDQTTPQGNLAAFGVTGDRFHGFSKSFVEHGIIMGLAYVRTDISYQQGIERRFSRRTRYDYYWPVFSHLGEQAILNKEIYAQGPGVVDPTTGEPYDESVFGYQERWAEYRYGRSILTGRMRSTYLQPLDFWHYGEYFTELPGLNQDFIEDWASYNGINRSIAVQLTEPQFILDCYFKLRCVRPMPMYSVPGLVDHF